MMTEKEKELFEQFCKEEGIAPFSHEKAVALAAWKAAQAALNVPFWNAGRYCKSEDDCIAAGIRFGDYEKGVNDAIRACEHILYGRPLVTGLGLLTDAEGNL